MSRLNSATASISWKWLQGQSLAAVLARGATGSFIVKVAGMGLVFAVQAMLARLLKVHEYGAYIYVLTWINLLLLLGIWGWDTAAVRFVPAYLATKQWGRLRGFIRTSTWVTFTTSLLVAFVLGMGVWLFRSLVTDELEPVYWTACLILPINALLQVYCSTLQGMNWIFLSQLPQGIYRPILLAVSAAAAFLLFGYAPTALNTMFLNLLGALAVLGYTWQQFRRNRPAELRSAAAITDLPQWSGVAAQMLLVLSFNLLMNRFDILMLGILKGPSAAGIYSVTGRIAELGSFALVAVNPIMAPLISKLDAGNQKNELQNVAKIASMGILAFTLPLAAGIIAFGDRLLLLFGRAFTQGYMTLVILVVAQTINALSGSVGFFLTMTGRQRQAALILAFCTSVNILLNLALIPRYGTVGAASATAFTMVVWNVWAAWIVRRAMGIDPTVLGLLRKQR